MFLAAIYLCGTIGVLQTCQKTTVTKPMSYEVCESSGGELLAKKLNISKVLDTRFRM